MAVMDSTAVLLAEAASSSLSSNPLGGGGVQPLAQVQCLRILAAAALASSERPAGRQRHDLLRAGPARPGTGCDSRSAGGDPDRSEIRLRS